MIRKDIPKAQQHDTAARVKVLVQELNIMLRKASCEGVTVSMDLEELAGEIIAGPTTVYGTDLVQVRVKTRIDIGDEPPGVLA